MADIKTRDVVKGTIKKIDKAAIAADRMRSAYVQTKEKAEHTTHPDEHNAEEYASDRVEGGVDRITHEAAHQFDKQGRKGLEETKRNVSKAKDGVQRFREKRAAESMKGRLSASPGIRPSRRSSKRKRRSNSLPVLPVRKPSRLPGKVQPKPHRGRSKPRKRQSRPHSRRQRRRRKPHRLR